MATKDLNTVHPSSADAAIVDIRRVGKRVVTFLGFSGSGYEDSGRVNETIAEILKLLDPKSSLVNSGGTTDGIGVIYSIAKARGFSTIGIVSALAEKEKSALSPDADKIYIISDETWGGLNSDGQLSPTSLAMVGASDEMVAIGGDEITRDELCAGKEQGKQVRYIPADMNHAVSKRKAIKDGEPEPPDFRGAAYKVFGENVSE